jgi:dCTP deaminase
MMLAGHELTELIQAGYINAPYSQVGTSSIDVRLGNTFGIERADFSGFVDPRKKSSEQFEFFETDGFKYYLPSGGFILASTEEAMALPDDISAQFMLKSSIARCGITHALAGFVDAGFRGNVTLELHNWSRNPVLLTAGMPIGQFVFYRHVPTGERSYAKRGQYVGDKAKGTVASEGAK